MILPPFFGLYSKYNETFINEVAISYISADIITYSAPTGNMFLTYKTLDILSYTQLDLSNTPINLSYLTTDILSIANPGIASNISFLTCDILSYELPPRQPDSINQLFARDKDSLGVISWQPPFDGKSSITGYIIDYKLIDSEEWINFGIINSTNINIPLTNNNTYIFRAAPINKIGTGEYTISNSIMPYGGQDIDCDIVAYVGFNTADLVQSVVTSCSGTKPINVTQNIISKSGAINTLGAYFPGTEFLINTVPHTNQISYPHINIPELKINSWSLIDNFTISFWFKPDDYPMIPGVFTLFGAGRSSINGCYAVAGTFNSRPYYTQGGSISSSWYVYYAPTGPFSASWFIGNTMESSSPQNYIYRGADTGGPSLISNLFSWTTDNIGPSPPPYIEHFTCTAAAPTLQTILSAVSTTTNNAWKISYINNSIIFSSGTISNMINILSATNLNISTNIFTHISLCRSNNYISFFVNGIEKTETFNANNITVDTNYLIVGGYGANYNYSTNNNWGIIIEPFKGVLDEVFVSKSALYRGNFSLPQVRRDITAFDCEDCGVIPPPPPPPPPPLAGFMVTSTGSESPNKLGLYCPDGTTFNGRPVYRKDGPADTNYIDSNFPKYIYYTTNANVLPNAFGGDGVSWNGWAQSPDVGNNQTLGGNRGGGIYAFAQSDDLTPPGTLTNYVNGNGNLILTSAPGNC